ncbi:MAG: multicopper oxidase domain-containing protein [Planctomycetes bacterium]|nr:multicopper oxidase domain-containing protein [Planctomycetota bacterium]
MTEFPLQNSTSRRQFLKGSAAVAAATIASSQLSANSLSNMASVDWALEAKEVNDNFPNGGTVHYYRYEGALGSETRGRIPFYQAAEGSTVVIGVRNSTRIPIQPQIPGIVTGPRIRPGRQALFTFTMPAAGTYLLTNAAVPQVTGTLGMNAVMVSRPSSGLNEIWNGGPTFDREYILHYSDSDSRWNADAANVTLPNLATYQPNYFTLNGLSYPDISTDPDTLIVCNLGERVLLRMSNSGLMRQSIHFHGYHVQVVSRNNQPITNFPMKDTVEVAAGTTVEVIIDVNQTGTYPVHPHSLTAVTANGLYPYGALNLIVAS